MRSASCSPYDAQHERASASDNEEDDEIEQKFQSTYDEVIALKKLLQDLLNVSDAVRNDDANLELDSPCPSSHCSIEDEYAEVEYEVEEGEEDALDLPNDKFHSEGESESEPLVHARIMCFSDEMRTFTPDLLLPERSAPLRPSKRISSTRTPVAPLRRHHHEIPEGQQHPHQVLVEDEPVKVPRASRSSLKLLRESATFEPNFQARMRQFMAQNRQKKEQIRLSVCEKEDECIRASPTINRRSKRIYRNVSHLMAWNYEKETKLSHMRQEEVAKQSAQVLDKPAIARHSSALFDRREDDLAQCKVEDRLQLLGLIYQYQQEERLIAQSQENAGRSHPSVAPHSANLTRQQSAPLAAHERLYQLAKRRAKRENDSKNADNQTDHEAKQPSSKSKLGHGHEAVPAAVQRLWSIGEAYKKKRQELVEHQNQQVDQLLNTPKLSSRSREIAIKRGNRDAGALHGTSQHHKRCACCRRNANATADDSGANTRASCRVDAAQASAIYEKQLRWKREKDVKDSQLKEFYDALTRSECTFRNPFYKDAWNTLASGQGGDECEATDHNANTAFFERAIRWAAEKERRVAHEKKIWDEIQLGECTFKPQLSPRKKCVSPRANRSWSPGRGMVVNEAGGEERSYPQTPMPRSYSKSYRLKSPTHLRQQLRLTKFSFPKDFYDALDLEALAGVSSSEPASSPISDDSR